MLSIRKLGIIGRGYRHAGRYRQILTVFIKYGFGELIELLRVGHYIDIGWQLISRRDREQATKLSRAERVRLAFEELGPTFIKLGQILSTQPGLIPIDIATELARLQDSVPACGFAPIQGVLEQELGAPLDKAFLSIDKIPLASASIAQVYAARLPDGEEVAVKVQRPGIQKTVEVDLEIMLYLATLMENYIEEVAPHKPSAIVEEFARVLEKELDFSIEATNIEQFASLFANDHTIHIPEIIKEKTTARVLMMEYIQGVKLSDIERLQREGYDPEKITVRIADIMFTQIFRHGFFHADPHPGNIFILPGNVICMLDFGMVGSVDVRRREIFVDLIDGLARKNVPYVTQALLRLTTWERKPDTDALSIDITEFMGRHLFKPLKELEIGKGLQDLLELLASNKLRLPPNIFLMTKAFGTLEGISKKLNPDIDLISHAAPFVARVKLGRFSPQRITTSMMRIATDWHTFTQQFPNDLLEITRLLKNDNLTLKVDHKGLKPLISKYDQISNRISFAIIIAALLLGSALIITAKIPPLVFGFSVLGLVGFTGAAVLGLWLLVAVLWKGGL